MLPFPFLPANVLEETQPQNSSSEFIYTLVEVHHVSQESEAWWRVEFYAICLAEPSPVERAADIVAFC